MTQTSTTTQTPTAADLRNCTSRTQANALIAGLKTPALRAIATELEIAALSRFTKAGLVEAIVYLACGARLDSMAIRQL